MIRYHSVLCTHLLNGLLFSYFLGSDTMHIALKYGVFSELTLSQFLFVVAGCGILTYAACAFVFTMKSKHATQETGMTKGLMLKRSVQLYSLVQAAFLGLAFMLIITYQLYTFWGSRVLCLVLGLNLLVPFIAISFLSSDSSKKSLVTPSETDKFMMKKGGNADLHEVK